MLGDVNSKPRGRVCLSTALPCFKYASDMTADEYLMKLGRVYLEEVTGRKPTCSPDMWGLTWVVWSVACRKKVESLETNVMLEQSYRPMEVKVMKPTIKQAMADMGCFVRVKLDRELSLVTTAGSCSTRYYIGGEMVIKYLRRVRWRCV